MKRFACAVCNLRADVLICRECADDPAASLARVEQWMAGLGNDAPARAEMRRLDKAAALLSTLIVPAAICQDCQKPFDDINRHGYCDACLCERINGAGILELDD
jgi:hypothetical protein